MPNISVEQQFPDPAYVLKLVLSALGQDPQHDFDNDGGRTFSKGGDDCNNSIASDMIKLLELCKARAQQSGGSKKYKQKGGDGESKMQQIVLRGSMNEIEIVADETSRSMIRNITTSIFADGIKLALSSASVFNQSLFSNDDEFDDVTPTQKIMLNDPSILEQLASSVPSDTKLLMENMLSSESLQSNFIDSAKSVLSRNNDISGLTVVEQFYKTDVLNALNNPLNIDLLATLSVAEENSRQYLMQQVSAVLQGDDNVCLYNVNSAMDLINDYAQQAGVPLIQPGNFVNASREEQVEQLKRMRRSILLKLHPDKVPEQYQAQAMELFVKAQPSIDNLISSCFQVGSLLDSDDDDHEMQFGGAKTDKCKKLKIMNTKILNESTKFMMNYLRCVDYNPNMTVTPKFKNINIGPPELLKRSPVTGQMVNPGRIQLNAQILILWVHVTDGTSLNTILRNAGFGSDLSGIREYLDVLALPENVSIWLGGKETGMGMIDNQTQEAHNIVIRNYFPEAIYQDNNPIYGSPTKFPLPKTKDRFVVNNAAIINDKDEIGITYTGKQIKKNHIFCPIGSVLDAMRPCSIGSALKNQKDSLYPMNYVIQDIYGKLTYQVSYEPRGSGKQGYAILNATLSKSSRGNLFTISKQLNYASDDLSATEGYRGVITQLHKLYQTKASEGMVLRGQSDMRVFMDFLQQVMGDAIGAFAVKSIGDYAQEGTVTANNSATTPGSTPEEVSTAKITPTNSEGDAFRLGIANDRPSAYRMIDQLLYATNDSKNKAAIVGYFYKDSDKNFLVHLPTDNVTVQQMINNSLTPISAYGGAKKKTRKRKYKKRKTNKRRRRKKKTKRRKSTRKTKRNKRKN